MANDFYNSLLRERTLWSNFKKGYEEYYGPDNEDFGYIMELKFFFPYVIFLDEEHSEVALANREYKPLGIMGKYMENRPFVWIPVDMSQLPELDFVKDEEVNGRTTKCFSLYYQNPPYRSDKASFDLYLQKLVQLHKACKHYFILPRFITAMGDLYSLKKRNNKLVDEIKSANRMLREEAKKYGQLKRQYQELLDKVNSGASK